MPVLLPSVVIKRGTRGGGRSGALHWRGTDERTMNAMGFVIIRECVQLSRPVDRVPEEDAVEVLALDRADQTVNERMRQRCAGDRLDLLDLADVQVGAPAVKAKQRVVVGADVFRWGPAGFAAAEVDTPEAILCLGDARRRRPE